MIITVTDKYGHHRMSSDELALYLVLTLDNRNVAVLVAGPNGTIYRLGPKNVITTPAGTAYDLVKDGLWPERTP